MNLRRIVRRHLLSKLLRPSTRVAINLNAPLHTLWYENENGDKWVPDLKKDFGDPAPEGFIYQHSRFPRSLVENVLRLVTREDVDSCTHPEILVDHGLIAGLEGRTCRFCGGFQHKKVGAPWPTTWEAYGSRPAWRSESSYQVDVILAMVRPSADEMRVAQERGYTITPTPFDRAVILYTTACSRCVNVLAWRHGLADGYEEGSPEWNNSNTRCELCEDHE